MTYRSTNMTDFKRLGPLNELLKLRFTQTATRNCGQKIIGMNFAGTATKRILYQSAVSGNLTGTGTESTLGTVGRTAGSGTENIGTPETTPTTTTTATTGAGPPNRNGARP